MISAHVMHLSDIFKVFEVVCDTSWIGIGRVLAQEGHPIAYSSEKLNDARLQYSTYDSEFYAVIQALCNWRHYLLSQVFVLYSDYEALKYHFQKKLNARYGRWIEFLQDYTFTLHYKEKVKYKAVDAVSRHMFILIKMSAVVNDTEKLKTENGRALIFATYMLR